MAPHELALGSAHPASRKWKALASGVVAVTALAYSAWTLNGRTFFAADDWPWLWRAEFSSWSVLLQPLPLSIYNDRPVGAVVIKVLYGLFAFDQPKYQIVLLSLHAINCLLLYSLSERVIGTLPAIVAGILAATWFSALDAVTSAATIFDLLGATLCLAMLRFRLLAARTGNAAYDIAGLIFYVLAIRTKEFALGMVGVVFLSSMLLDRRSLRDAIKQAMPYIVVFAIFAARYAQLMVTTPPEADGPYHLVFTPQTAWAKLEFYLGVLLYRDGTTYGPAAGLIGYWAAFVCAGARARTISVFGLAAFVIVCGPTLFLPNSEATSYHRLYLYAPHFFLAFALAALLAGRMLPTVIASAVAIGVMAAPFLDHSRLHAVNFYQEKSRIIRAQFNGAMQLLTPLERGATVFISGVEPFFNPFSNPEGNSIAIGFKDPTIRVVVEIPDAELIEQFCATTSPRRFLSFDGPKAADVTSQVAQACQTRR